jgi:hypothetical protein
MDAGTNALDILTDRVYPTELGFIIDRGKGLDERRKDKEAFVGRRLWEWVFGEGTEFGGFFPSLPSSLYWRKRK